MPERGRPNTKDGNVIARDGAAATGPDGPIDQATDLACNPRPADGAAEPSLMAETGSGSWTRLRDLMTKRISRSWNGSSTTPRARALSSLLYAATRPLTGCVQSQVRPRLAAWLRARRVHGYAQLAARAVAAARTQQVALPGQQIAAEIVSELAGNVLTLDERLKELDAQIAATFDLHPQAAIIQSMPGFGPFLGASLLATAGDLRAFPSAGHLAAAAGLVPVPNDSGRRTGNLHKPRRYSRPLRHVFYLSAQTSMIRPGPNRDYYLKKRQRGRTHNQAVIALARRRIDVLWALLRDNRTYTPQPPPLTALAA